jgi:hypothetical protein
MGQVKSGCTGHWGKTSEVFRNLRGLENIRGCFCVVWQVVVYLWLEIEYLKVR